MRGEGGEGRALLTLPPWIPRQLPHHLKIIGLRSLVLQLIEVGHRYRVTETLDSPCKDVFCNLQHHYTQPVSLNQTFTFVGY
jgi:hypothetical protein